MTVSTAPTIVSERLTGVIGCMVLCLSSLICLGIDSTYSYMIIVCVLAIVGILVILLTSKKIRTLLMDLLCRIKFIKKRIAKLQLLYDSTVAVMGLKVLIKGTVISVCYWFMECMIFKMILIGMGIEMSLSMSVFVLTTVSIGAGLSMMPGSIGALEGGLVGMLVYYGNDVAVAGAVALLHRFFAMWLIVIIGAFFLLHEFRR